MAQVLPHKSHAKKSLKEAEFQEAFSHQPPIGWGFEKIRNTMNGLKCQEGCPLGG